MYKYKRGINNIDQARIIDFTMSNGKNTCFCMSGALCSKKPYNGMYIKNGKVILESLAEEITVDGKVNKLVELKTLSKEHSCSEFITSIDLEKNVICYSVEGVLLQKRIVLSDTKDMLCIEYSIKNDTKFKTKMRILPLVTYRDLFFMKNATMLKFNQRHINDGVMVNLSIINDENLVIKSNKCEYTEESSIVSNVVHEMINKKLEKKEFVEDLFLPGYFEIEISPSSETRFNLCIADTDFNVKNIDFDEIYSSFVFRKTKAVSNIADEFVELKDLACLMDNFSFDDMLITKLPYSSTLDYSLTYTYEKSIKKFEEDILMLINAIKSVEGQYLIFDKFKEANKVFVKVRKCIRECDSLNIDDANIILNITRLKLWYIEEVNRLIQKYPSYMDFHIDFIKEVLYGIFDNEKVSKIALSHIETVAFSFNGIEVYANILNKLKRQDMKMADIAICIQNLVNDKFRSEENRCMKETIDSDIAVPNISMIYTLSLSYPCIYGSETIKLLDTIFKELYTPYGLREVPRSSEHSKGIIYPEYMAHFVKANLRQNGVTMASQKIAFNLVKELILDIGKYVNGGIKKMYNEKGILVDFNSSFDLYTNAEIIRLYDMLS